MDSLDFNLSEMERCVAVVLGTNTQINEHEKCIGNIHTTDSWIILRYLAIRAEIDRRRVHFPMNIFQTTHA